MKLREVFRLELGYQARRPWPWIYFIALFGINLNIILETYAANALNDGHYFDAPLAIATVTFLASFMGLLGTAAFAGDAAARDVQIGMHPLLYTSALRTGTFVTGRFLAALTLNAVILISGPAALAVATLFPSTPKELLGPAQPGAYGLAYLLFALPNAVIATAFLFSAALVTRRAIAGYLGAVVIFFSTLFAYLFVAVKMGHWQVAKIVDPMALTVLSEVSRSMTGAEKNTLSLIEVGSLLANRAIWMTLALGMVALAWSRFRFEQPQTRTRRLLWLLGPTRAADQNQTPRSMSGSRMPVSVISRPTRKPRPRSGSGAHESAFATHLRQAIAIAWYSFRDLAVSWGGLVLVILTLLLVVFGPNALSHLDIPLIPTTQQMTAFVGNTGELAWTIIPILTVFYAGELVSREREAGLGDIADATPTPDWARLVGRFGGLVLGFAAYQTMLLLAAMLIQMQRGYFQFELGLYLQVLFGLQLIDHVLFAMLAITVHVLVDQKYVGYLVTIAALGVVLYAPSMGIEHKLLVYGSDTGWTFTDIRRFGPAILPWFVFKLYWGLFAVLLAALAKLFWIRGRERSAWARLGAARTRLTRPTLAVVASVATAAAALGAFILYNTNVLNAYETADDATARRAEYERRYQRYYAVPQPLVTRTTLRAELYPGQHRAELRGTYRLLNLTDAPIDSIHMATSWGAETGPATFDREVTVVVNDNEHGHRIYALGAPLAPGDSIEMTFMVRLAPRGFTNGGIDATVARNGTFIDGVDWMPAIGYQRHRELAGRAQRQGVGLPPRVPIRPLEDSIARMDMSGAARVTMETTVGTDRGQIAVAPGKLVREWEENERRYFHYLTDRPVRNDFALFSAAYAVSKGEWHHPDSNQTVDIQILHHPTHTKNPEAMIRSVQASLATLTPLLGPYPHSQARLVEHPGNGGSLHAYPVNVSFEEEFSLLDSANDPRNVDFPFAVVAHEMAHQWWGGVITGANMEGAALLSESLAWYSAMGVVEATYGTDHLTRLLGIFRDTYLQPRPDAAPPLLRASDDYHGYRKGPFAMYALREYIGPAAIDTALGRFIRAFRSGKPPLPTSLDLYRELRAVTPDSVRRLLADMFETNTYWELQTKRIGVVETGNDSWRVTLDVRARKMVVDTAGIPTDVPMNDLIEIGVYAPDSGEARGKQLYLRQHRIRAGDQQIVVTVQGRPGRGGIDPRHLLIDVEPNDNIRSTSRGASVAFR